jgi:PKD repeat protein
VRVLIAGREAPSRMRRRSHAAIAVAALLLIALALPSLAGAQTTPPPGGGSSPTGSISGHVTTPANAPAAGVCVTVFDALGGAYAGYTETDSSGNYTVFGLANGTYKVQFYPCDIAGVGAQWWSAKADWFFADTITLSSALPARSGIDAHLQAASSISGRVTNSLTHGPASVCVEAYGQYGGVYDYGYGSGGFAETDSTGNYRITDLQPGKYKLYFYACGSDSYISEYYDGKADWASADVITLGIAEARSGANADLEPAASIAGHVTVPAGSDPADVCVAAFTSPFPEPFVPSSYTGVDDAGNYVLTGLRAGTYQLDFYDCGGGSLITQFYASTITLATAEKRTGVDIQMQRSASISGHVTRTGGAPAAGVCVGAYSETVKNSLQGSAFTDSNGDFTIPGLSAGAYKLRYFSCSIPSGVWYQEQWYNAKPTWETATVLHIATSEARTGANATVVPAASISGHVTGPTGAPATGACVIAWAPDVQSVSLGFAYVDSNGDYTMTGLVAGSYKLQFSSCNGGLSYLTQFYNAKSTYAAADVITLATSEARTGVNQQLATAASITGRVTGPSGTGLAGVCVSATPVSFSGPTSTGFGTTDSAGNYKVVGLLPGSYKVEFYSCNGGDHVTQFYSRRSTLAAADTVTLSTSQTLPNVDAQMQAGGGSIAGRVTSIVTGAPLPNVCVRAYSVADGVAYSSALTNANGDYVLGGFPTGSYRLLFYDCSSSQSYLDQWYPGTDSSNAVAIPVTLGQRSSTAANAVMRSSIDTIAPNTTITAQPANPVSSTAASFSFSSTESGSFECKLDNADFAACTGPQQYTGLANGSHTFSVRAIDAYKNVDASPASYTWTVDTIPPDTSITTKPPAATNTTAASFAISSTETGSTFECKLDAGSFGPCSSTPQYTSLAAGQHTFTARAIDAAKNVDATPIAYSWVVDLTPPDTSISAKPVALANSSTADFTVASNELGSTFECKLDAGSFTPCTSTPRYVSLGEGSHTFSVRATDPARNVDPTAATYTWTVDTIPPDTSITAKPAALVNTGVADFSFEASETGTTLECNLDGAGFSPCTSPRHLTGLADGQHTFSVRAIDAAKNADASPASFTWTVDTTPPDTSVTSNPPARTKATSANFSIASTETGSTYECKLDAGNFAACTSAPQYSSLSEGTHTFTARATDQAKNVDPTPVAYTWTVDLTPPDTAFSAKPAALANSPVADFSLTSTEAGSTFECKLDAGSFTSCSSTPQYAGLADGQHTVSVRATDAALNTDATPATYTWTIDTVPPETSITAKPAALVAVGSADFAFTSPEATATFECKLDAAAYSACTSVVHLLGLADGAHTFSVRALDAARNADATPATFTWSVDATPPDSSFSAKPGAVVNSTAADFTFASTEAGSTFECKLDTATFAACTSPRHLTGLSDGSHTMSLRAIDAAKNVDPTPVAYTWTVDTAAPDTSISSKPAAVVGSGVADFAFGATEAGSRFECKLDTGAYAACTSPQHYTGLGNGQHTFSARAIDPAGNVDATPATWTWSVDPAANKPPTAAVTLSPSAGTAPLSTSISISGSDPDSDALTYRLSFDDGTTESGSLPHANLPHSFAAVGTHLVSLAVTDGHTTTTATATATVARAEPLSAVAGDDQIGTAATPVAFDGSGSKPSAGITAYKWDFGDGTNATGATASHAYSAPGKYTATLTVSSQGSSATDSLVVEVKAAAPAGITVHLQSHGAPVPGGQAQVITSDGVKLQATADGSGNAKLSGLPDGDYTVYGWASGYRPGAASTHVADGAGTVTIELEPGAIATAKLDSKRLTLDEIKKAGIDPNDPQNQNVFQFEVWLAFSPTAEPVKFSGYGGGGGFLGGGFSGASGGGGSCTEDLCKTTSGGYNYYAQIQWVDDQPSLIWMVIPVKGKMLKEFFDVSMVVENLADSRFKLTHGTATLQIPGGLSLAPTARPQSLSATMPDIPGGGSATQSWIVRGDQPGLYSPTADYSGSLDPVGLPVSLHAATVEPLKVWGTSALHLVVDVDKATNRHSPYHVRVGVENVADVPVYNAGIELLKQGKQHYIYQPREHYAQETDEIGPGDTWWTDDYILLPDFSGTLVLEKSFIKKISGDTGFTADIISHPASEVEEVAAHGLHNKVVLKWDPTPGATGYEIFSTPDDQTDFTDKPLPIRMLGPTKAVVDNVSPADGSRLYAVSSLIGKKRTMVHPLTSVEALDYAPSPTTDIAYDPPCQGTVASVHMSFEEEDFNLAQYEIDPGNGVVETYPLPAQQAAMAVRDFDVSKAPTIKVRAQNSDGDWGPWADMKLERCNYVALGDSFSSGEGVPDFESKTKTDDDSCHRSLDGAYSKILEADNAVPESLDFVACSGAVMSAFDTPSNGEDAQGDHLRERTKLVTLTFGGNNVHFAQILETCIGTGLVSAFVDNRLGLDRLGLHIGALLPACKPIWAHKVDEEMKKLDAGPNTGGSLANLYTRVQAKARHARVLVVGYPQIFSANSLINSCWGITAADVRWIHDVQERFNELIARAADSAGVEYVDPSQAFDDHDVCSSDPWVNTPVEMVDSHGVHPEYGFHPNRSGQTELAKLIERQLAGNGGAQQVMLQQGGQQIFKVLVKTGIQLAAFKTLWPGSDVVMSLKSPSGRVITRDSNAPDVEHSGGGTFELFNVKDPEPGEWTVTLYGKSLAPGGESVSFSDAQVPVEKNLPPTAIYARSTDAGEAPLTVDFDASGSFDSDGSADGYSWDFGDGSHGSGVKPSHTYTTPGSYLPRLTVTDDHGAEDTFELLPVEVRRAGVSDPFSPGELVTPGNSDGGGGPLPVPADRTAPIISAFSAAPRSFKVGSRATPVTAKVARGTKFRFVLSENATTTLTIARAAKKRCGSAKHRRTCTSYKTVGKLVRTSAQGPSTMPFSGRIGRRALASGGYRVVAVARDGAGNASAPRKLSLTIVR